MCWSHSGAHQKQTKPAYQTSLRRWFQSDVRCTLELDGLWWEHDLISIRHNCWRNIFGLNQLSVSCTVHLDLQKRCVCLLAFPLHVNFDQSKSSCHDLWCCILVRFTNLIAKFGPEQTVWCQMEPKRLKNATMYNFFLPPGPDQTSQAPGVKQSESLCSQSGAWHMHSWLRYCPPSFLSQASSNLNLMEHFCGKKKKQPKNEESPATAAFVVPKKPSKHLKWTILKTVTSRNPSFDCHTHFDAHTLT